MKTLVFTGGHHNSALPVAKILIKNGYQIVWFGHRHSMWGDVSDSGEYKDVTALGIPFYDLQAGKFYNTFNPFKLIRIPFGFIQALLLLLLLRPNAIVSFGGYLAVPTVICGWLLGIPAITHEQTVVSGLANKLIVFFVKKIALTWPSSLQYYPKNKTVLIGLPLRSEIVNLKQQVKPGLIYITGGKQGSHIINEVVFQALPELTKKYDIIHQTGSSSLYHDFEKSQQFNYSNYQSFDYDSNKATDALRRADVVITRGGAHIIYELGFLGKRCVVIPIPWVSHDEQTENAKILEINNQAVILPQDRLNIQCLDTNIMQAQKLTPKYVILPNDATQKLYELVVTTFFS